MDIDPQYAELVAAVREALAASTKDNPRDAITTEAAVREGNVMSGIVIAMPEPVRPMLRMVIAEFDRETLPVPVWDIERITPAHSADLQGFASYDAPQGSMALSTPIFRGRFSKFRIGMETDGSLVGVKQMRSDRNAVADETRRVTQHPLMTLPMAIIVREVIMMQTLTQAIKPTRVLRRGNDIYVVMPLMRCTLADMVSDGTQPPTGTGRSIALHIAEALRRIHARGFLHGDVKLDNVLCNEAGTLELCDFAMAMKLTAPKLPGAQRGTPQTSAPEIVTAQPFDARCDVWSLGIALLELYAGANAANPFHLHGTSDGGARWHHAQVQHAAYAQWREHLVAQGPINESSLGKAAQDPTPFGAFVRGCVASDPALATYAVNRMLEPKAEQRATIAEAVDALGALAQAQSAPWPVAPPADASRERALAGLRKLRGLT